MDVFFETQSGDTFEIELDYWDTVLDIKQKIEKYQRIHVSKQTLFFQGKVLQDHLDIEQCVIHNHSRIQIFVEPDPNPNHNNEQVHQTEISPPLDSSYEIDSFQDSPVSTSLNLGSNNNDHLLLPENFNSSNEFDNFLESPFWTNLMLGSNNNDHLLLPENLNSSNEIDNFQDSPVSTSMMLGSNNNDQLLLPENSLPLNSDKEIVKHITLRSIPMVMRPKVQALQTEKSLPLNSSSDLDNFQDSSVSTSMKFGSNNNDQVLPQPERSTPLNSYKDIANTQGPPVKRIKLRGINNSHREMRSYKTAPGQMMSVLVKPYYGEGRVGTNIFVTVNTKDQVKILRNELAQSQQRGEINLPQDGYFFMHRNEVLNEDRSFKWNGVIPDDFAVEIRPRNVNRGS
ncbi:unnamed protein product [Arabidopsis arenosa]|uniref:Ubiquitin-like domain-containing protein n=1 Tax=Arabidopsis arenosa TaxID=38785 RepID=A0A8S2AXN5_ARAAE|nr:unnamed protein product [Arabidopsis arenosa]